MKKNNMLATTSLILSIISFIIFLVWPNSNAIIGLSLVIILGLTSIITGFIGKKQIKINNEKGDKLALTGIILGFIASIVSLLAVIGFAFMENPELSESICMMEQYTNNCVDNQDGTSTCTYAETAEVICSTKILKENQFKDEE